MISTKRGTLGVRLMPDKLDSGYCHLQCPSKAVIRVNIDGIYIALCVGHRAALMDALFKPEPAPIESKG